MAETEPKKGLNKETTAAGLCFNVHPIKSKMLEMYNTAGYVYTRKDKEGNENEGTFTFKKGHVAVTACVEEMTRLIFRDISKYAEPDESGLRQVGAKSISQYITSQPGYKEFFGPRHESWSDNTQWADLLPVARDSVKGVMDSVAKDLTVSGKGLNYIYFLLYQTFSGLVNRAAEFVSFADRRTVDKRSVIFAVRNMFEAGEVRTSLETAVNNAIPEDTNDGTDEQDNKAEEKTEKSAPKKDAKKETKNKSKKGDEKIDVESADEDEGEKESKNKGSKDQKSKGTKDVKDAKDQKSKNGKTKEHSKASAK